jgi:hypothetical protein
MRADWIGQQFLQPRCTGRPHLCRRPVCRRGKPPQVDPYRKQTHASEPIRAAREGATEACRTAALDMTAAIGCRNLCLFAVD